MPRIELQPEVTLYRLYISAFVSYFPILRADATYYTMAAATSGFPSIPLAISALEEAERRLEAHGPERIKLEESLVQVGAVYVCFYFVLI